MGRSKSPDKKAELEQFGREADAYYGSRDSDPCECGHGRKLHELDENSFARRSCLDCSCQTYRKAQVAA
jgi:hypothetical protein